MDTGAAPQAVRIDPRARAGRDAQACDLRKTGMSLQAIGNELGVSKRTVGRMLNRAYLAVVTPAVDDLREVENQRITGLIETQLETVRNPGPLASGGRIVDDVDRDVRTRAVTEIRKLIETRARLFGLNAPTQRYVTISDQRINDEVERALAQVSMMTMAASSQPAAIETVEADWHEVP